MSDPKPVEWVPVPGFPGARMVDSETHPPIHASDIDAANAEHEKYLARKARHVGSETNPQVRPLAGNRTLTDITGQVPGTPTRTTSDDESASEGFLGNFAGDGDNDDTRGHV